MRRGIGCFCSLPALLLCLPAFAVVPVSERDALIAIYLSTGGDQWAVNTNWCDGPCPASGVPKFNHHGTECKWAGIICQTGERNILGFQFANNHLVGQLPPLGALTAALFVDAPFNELSGPIPSDIVSLKQLRDVDLRFNGLSGPVPDFSGLAYLASIELSGNQLSGSVAPLIDLPALEDFQISTNQLSGLLPTFAGLYSLTFIAVDDNAFVGLIPDLSETNVVLFYADHNQLSGPLPPPSNGFSRRTVRLCPNPLSLEPGPYDSAWSLAAGESPWWGPPGGGCDHIFSSDFD